VLRKTGVNVQMISQGASKVLAFLSDHSEESLFPLFFLYVCVFWTPCVYEASISEQVNMSLVVHDSEARACVKALHQAFFEDDVLTEAEAEGLVVG
jgi:hypothetical protein